MGDVKKIMASTISKERLLATRLCFDMCENIHIHYRDIRLEFSIDEFCLMCDFLTASREEIFKIQSEGYLEGRSHDLVMQRSVSVLPTPKYGGGWMDDFNPERIRIELQKNGYIHIHYHDLRLEMTKAKFIEFAKIIYQSIDDMPLNADGGYEKTWYHQSLSRCGMSTRGKVVKLSDLTCAVFHKRDITAKPLLVKVTESPFYASLAASFSDQDAARKIYNDYVSFVSTHPDAQRIATFDEYLDLFEDVRANGIGKDIVVECGVIKDGHHRACILWHLYGDVSIFVASVESVL